MTTTNTLQAIARAEAAQQAAEAAAHNTSTKPIKRLRAALAAQDAAKWRGEAERLRRSLPSGFDRRRPAPALSGDSYRIYLRA